MNHAPTLRLGRHTGLPLRCYVSTSLDIKIAPKIATNNTNEIASNANGYCASSNSPRCFAEKSSIFTDGDGHVVLQRIRTSPAKRRSPTAAALKIFFVFLC